MVVLNIDMYLLTILAIAVLVVVYQFIRKKMNLKKALVILLFFAYLYFAFGGILKIVTLDLSDSDVSTNLTNLENVELFTLLGFFVALLDNRKRSLKPVLITSLLVSLSLAIVFFSGVIEGKTPTYEMIIFNVIGGVVGYIIYKVFVWFMKIVHINTNLEDSEFITKKHI